MTVEEAIAVATQLNSEGMSVSLDSLGESVLQVSQAEESAAIYHRLLDEIQARKLFANVSVKLTQVGMDIGGPGAGPELAERIVGEMVEHAASFGSFVRIDMEGSEYTEATLAMTERLHEKWPGGVGTVLQAYLFRTSSDTERLLRQKIRIRLCKGAYKEPATIAFPAKNDVDLNYIKLMRRCVSSDVFCGIATHDEDIIEELRKFVTSAGLPKDAFEFQMLYGVRRDLQRKLVKRRLQACGSMCRLARSGTPTSCVAWPNARRTCIFLAKNLLQELGHLDARGTGPHSAGFTA